jgi:hypothetical protein
MQNTLGGSTDAFVAVLSPNLDQLIYSTYFGGASYDEPGGLAVDDVGNIYFSGNTCSPPTGPAPFPISDNAFDSTYPTNDPNGEAFIAKFNYPANPMDPGYSSYFGGGTIVDNNPCNELGDVVGFDGDRGRSLTLKSNGLVVICGDTDVSDLPTTTGALKTAYRGGESDAFAVLHKVN